MTNKKKQQNNNRSSSYDAQQDVDYEMTHKFDTLEVSTTKEQKSFDDIEGSVR